MFYLLGYSVLLFKFPPNSVAVLFPNKLPLLSVDALPNIDTFGLVYFFYPAAFYAALISESTALVTGFDFSS